MRHSAKMKEAWTEADNFNTIHNVGSPMILKSTGKQVVISSPAYVINEGHILVQLETGTTVHISELE